MQKIELSKTHKRILKSLLFVLEQKAEQIEHIINQPEENASYEIRQDLTEEKKEILLKSSYELKKSLHALADEYQLARRHISQAHYITTVQSQMWEIISDAFSDKMKGYGEQTVADAKHIDPTIGKIAGMIDKLKI